MEYSESIWNGFRRLDFVFEDKNALLICPNEDTEEKKWLLKTEYFGAFPGFEICMVEKGYYLAHVNNTTRWCFEEDTHRQARFAKFLVDEFGLAKKCMPVGMSCGGMQAVYLAAKYPQIVAAMYLDAPVLNLLSCPCGIGDATNELYSEFVSATGWTVSDMINYRSHPIDYVDNLVKNQIPVFLIAGDSDIIVPYHENGKYLADKYKSISGFCEIIKAGCNHHPHGLEDNTPLVEFAKRVKFQRY